MSASGLNMVISAKNRDDLKNKFNDYCNGVRSNYNGKEYTGTWGEKFTINFVPNPISKVKPLDEFYIKEVAIGLLGKADKYGPALAVEFPRFTEKHDIEYDYIIAAWAAE